MAMSMVLEKREEGSCCVVSNILGQILLGRVFATHQMFEPTFREVQEVKWVMSGLEEKVRTEVFIVQGTRTMDRLAA
jgi:hypothetical protein